MLIIWNNKKLPSVPPHQMITSRPTTQCHQCDRPPIHMAKHIANPISTSTPTSSCHSAAIKGCGRIFKPVPLQRSSWLLWILWHVSEVELSFILPFVALDLSTNTGNCCQDNYCYLFFNRGHTKWSNNELELGSCFPPATPCGLSLYWPSAPFSCCCSCSCSCSFHSKPCFWVCSSIWQKHQNSPGLAAAYPWPGQRAICGFPTASDSGSRASGCNWRTKGAPVASPCGCGIKL